MNFWKGKRNTTKYPDYNESYPPYMDPKDYKPTRPWEWEENIPSKGLPKQKRKSKPKKTQKAEESHEIWVFINWRRIPKKILDGLTSLMKT